MRVGIGYDSHRFDSGPPGRPLILGGVVVPHDRCLVGHSDADAVCHALTDAILGAAGLGDIGQMFPDTDPQWKAADSVKLLTRANLAVAEAGHHFAQADITVIAEAPKLAPHVWAMQQRLSEALAVAPSAISIKGKTNEGMGWIGRGEGIAAIAVATLS
jgi:2-C-methyl-D-erythritol 2,4-cyclodiphosphate synthase